MIPSGYPVEQSDNIQSVAFNKVLVEMYMERSRATEFILGGYPTNYSGKPQGSEANPYVASNFGMHAPESGTVIQCLYHNYSGFIPTKEQLGWRDLQFGIESRLLKARGSSTSRSPTAVVSTSGSHFANSADYPDGFEGEQELIPYSIHTWRAASNINVESGYVRKFPRAISGITQVGTSGHRAYLDPELDGRQGKTVYEYDGSIWIVADNQKIGPDIITSYGLMEEGDYIGPWIHNEIYSGLVNLKWVIQHHYLYASGEVYEAYGAANVNDTWANESSNIAGLYNLIPPGTGEMYVDSEASANTVYSSGEVPALAYGDGDIIRSYWNYTYTSSVPRTTINTIQATRVTYGLVIPSGFVCDIDFYGYVEDPSEEWDVPGTGGFDSSKIGSPNQGELSILESKNNASYSDGIHEITVGNLELPVTPPTPPGTGISRSYGFAVYKDPGLNPGFNADFGRSFLFKYDHASGFKHQ